MSSITESWLTLDEYMLTTTDNPYNPYVQYDEWYSLDRQLGHYTCEYLARICENISYDLEPEDRDDIIKDAIDRIVDTDPLKLYVKVYPPEGYSPSEPEGIDPKDFEDIISHL